jgi:hypothetical protein
MSPADPKSRWGGRFAAKIGEMKFNPRNDYVTLSGLRPECSHVLSIIMPSLRDCSWPVEIFGKNHLFKVVKPQNNPILSSSKNPEGMKVL